jgi:tripeptide aminopeptidase
MLDTKPSINEARLVQLFRELCLIDAPAKKEREVADYVINVLKGMGLEVWEDKAGEAVGGNSGNVIALFKGTKPGAPRIFLSAHLDTVEPTAGLKIIEENGRLSSDGTTILGADDKGGMAPAIEAIRVIQESGEEHGDVVLLFSICEEIGLLGAANVELDDLNLEFGFVLDTGPPVGSFVTRTATHDMLNVTFIGKPAHAGKHPEDGINAIQVAADAVSRMKIGRIGPETTSNFGIIKGGTAVNVVCPSVTLYGEARSTNVAELDAQIAHMKEACQAAADAWGAKVEFDYERHYDAYLVDADSKVVKVGQAAAAKLGMSGDLRTTLGDSDANIYNAKGVPSIVVATGMEEIHTHNEFITIADLVATAELTVELIRESAKA